ncbi:MAG: hypothetical protein HUU01_12160 [Saprospiraceae bacterium]|nr:hypothetical protein [Saprospiraceae bacterium]
MQILTVTDKKTWHLFHRVLDTVYAGDPNFVYPLEKEIQGIFDPARNGLLQHGAACVYVLLDDKGKPVGRAAAFVDHEGNKNAVHPTGGIGFFECIPNGQYARALLEYGEAFLRDQGVHLVDAPVNFGQRDRYWGLLVKGFVQAMYQENYNPPYYEAFFLQNGYIPFEQILTFKGATADIPFERMRSIAQRLKERNRIDIKALDFNDVEGFAHDFCEVYNAAFDSFDHFKPLDPAQVVQFMKEAKGVADPGLACIAYWEGQPAGLIALAPDINPFIRHAKGKLNWWTIPLFLLKYRFAKTKNAKGLGFGVHADYRSKGIFPLLLDFLSTPHNVSTYPYMYLAGIRGHNHEIQSMYSKMNVKTDRVHVAFRKALVDGAPIVPFEFLEINESA